MDEVQFNEKYWFGNTKIVTVVNPREEDYRFQATADMGMDMTTGRPKIETRQYLVKKGSQERFPGPLANMYLDQMAKLVAQDDDAIQMMIDYATKAKYYDDLIVGVDDLMATYTPRPEFNNGEIKPEVEITEEVPFAAAKRPPGRPPKAVSEV